MEEGRKMIQISQVTMANIQIYNLFLNLIKLLAECHFKMLHFT